MIATRLDELLNERERSLYWLAKESGVGYKTLHKLARRRADSIKFDILDKICTLLGCAPGDVLIQVSASERGITKRRR